MLLNGLNVLGPQTFLALTNAAVSTGLKVLLIPHFGLAGLIWATIASSVCFALLPGVWLARQALVKMARVDDAPQRADKAADTIAS
jgi:hypothetical protein